MKKLSVWLVLLCAAIAAHSQGVRIDPSPLIGAQTGRPIPNQTITVCAATATGIPCSPHATTYTDQTLTTACADGFFVTLTGTSVCQATSDAQGNFGFWVASGVSYKYCITGPNITGQCYTINPGVFGAVTAQSVNGDLWVGSGTGQFPSISACLSAMVTGQSCNVPANWHDPTWTANTVVSQSQTALVFHGCATIPMSTFSMTKAAGVNNFTIRSYTTDQKFNPTSACVHFQYTGTGTALSMGGVGFSSGLTLADFFINITGAGANAHCLDVLGTDPGHIQRVICTGASSGSQIGLLMDGQCCGAGNTTTQDVVVDSFGVTGVGVTTGILCRNNCNANRIYNYFPSINPTTGIGLDFECVGGVGANANVADPVDLEILGTGVQFGNCGQVFGNRVRAFNEANVVDAVFGAASVRNYLDFLASAPIITDNSGVTSGNGWKWLGSNGLLCQVGPQSAQTGTGADLTMTNFSCPIPANTVGPGRGLRVTVQWFHNSGNTSTAYKLKFGSTVANSLSSTGLNSQGGVREGLTFRILNAPGVQNSQYGSVDLFLANANVANIFNSEVGQGGYGSSIDFTQAQTLTFAFNVANTDQVTPEFFLVELIQ